jgi:hypothetical protein
VREAQKIMTSITRRRFLKFVGLGVLASVMPIEQDVVKVGPLSEREPIPINGRTVLRQKIEFNPDFEYGMATECNGLKDNFVIRHLHCQAKMVLPKGTPYELRLIIPSIVDRAERRKPEAAWYYCPLMLRDAPTRKVTCESWEYIPEYGVYVRGRFYA